MDLSAFQAADNAVKKIAKDYKPIVDLSEALDSVRATVAELGNLEAKVATLKAEVRKWTDERSAAESAANRAKQESTRAQAILDEVRAKLAAFRE